jgi:hypothetical protein
MKVGTQAALAVGTGYLLGRRRKLRRAAILAAIVATGRSGGLSKALMGRGLKALEATELMGKITPELGEIADTARTELLDAGKTAAMALVTNRVESLSDSLRSRADVLKDPAASGRGAVEGLRGDGPDRQDQRDEPDNRDTRSTRNGRDKDEYDEYEAEDSGYEDEDAYDEDYAPDEGEEPGDYDGDDQEEPDEEEPAPAPRRRASVSSSPVSRAGR